MLIAFSIFLARGISKRSQERKASECDRRFCELHAHMSELVTMSGADRKRKRQTGWRKEKATPGIPAVLCRRVRKYLMNDRQSVSLFKRFVMTDLHLRAGGTPADRRQWDERSRKKIGKDSYIRMGVCLAQWFAFVDFSYAISLVGFFSKCRS